MMPPSFSLSHNWNITSTYTLQCKAASSSQSFWTYFCWSNEHGTMLNGLQGQFANIQSYLLIACPNLSSTKKQLVAADRKNITDELQPAQIPTLASNLVSGRNGQSWRKPNTSGVSTAWWLQNPWHLWKSTGCILPKFEKKRCIYIYIYLKNNK